MPRQLLNGQTFTVKETDMDLDDAVDEMVSYELRAVSVSQARQMIKRHTKRQRRGEDVVDDAALNREMLDYALVSWAGVEIDGVSVPCEVESKLMLPGPIQAELLRRAQMGGSAEDTAASFPKPS